MRSRHAHLATIFVAALCVALLAPALSALAAPPAPGPTATAATATAVATSTAVATATASGPVATSSADATASKEASIAAAGDSIVAMTAAAQRTGSGVMIAPGQILTSARVLKKNDPTVRIMTVDGTLYPFTIIGRDDAHGLVLLGADITGVKPISGWGQTGTLVAGDEVHMLGLQSGAREVLDVKGTIASPAAATGGDLILTDIKIDPLVEGGALITPDGKLAGLVTAKNESPVLGELGWAVTAESARDFVNGIAEKQRAAAAESEAVIIRRWVVRGILAFIAALFILFGWWFRRWYKRMEAREAAEMAAEEAAEGHATAFAEDADPDAGRPLS